jgi:hypothetical protein
MAPELIVRDAEELEDIDYVDRQSRFLTKATDVYAFSMLSVEVGLFQMIIIPVFPKHYYRFCLDSNPIRRYVTILESRSKFQKVYDQEGKSINYRYCMRRYGTSWSFVG